MTKHQHLSHGFTSSNSKSNIISRSSRSSSSSRRGSSSIFQPEAVNFWAQHQQLSHGVTFFINCVFLVFSYGSATLFGIGWVFTFITTLDFSTNCEIPSYHSCLRNKEVLQKTVNSTEAYIHCWQHSQGPTDCMNSFGSVS